MTMPMNISWLPRLMVLVETPMEVWKPLVRAEAMFMRSSWKTRRPRKRRGRTVVSALCGGWWWC